MHGRGGGERSFGTWPAYTVARSLRVQRRSACAVTQLTVEAGHGRRTDFSKWWCSTSFSALPSRNVRTVVIPHHVHGLLSNNLILAHGILYVRASHQSRSSPSVSPSSCRAAQRCTAHTVHLTGITPAR